MQSLLVDYYTVIQLSEYIADQINMSLSADLAPGRPLHFFTTSHWRNLGQSYATMTNFIVT